MGEFKEERILSNKELQDIVMGLRKKVNKIDTDLDTVIELNDLRFE